MSIFSSLPGILLIILGFGVLIFIHELGHFLAAKWAGIRTEAFAVGMGPVMVSWRKGVGFAPGSTHRKVVARCGKPAADLTDEELVQHGVGETEYSLRWLPIGGFVKMLGQEDANPNAVSDDPRSYTVCPIGKRMVVVSAGVIMNVLLAMVLFIWAFMVGVRFEGPVLGEVAMRSPAARAVAINADELGVTDPGLRPGDEVVTIDGDEARTFADIQIATAMARPGTPVALGVRRNGVEGTLSFLITPEPSKETGLLSIGVQPGRSTQLFAGRDAGEVKEILELAGLSAAGVAPGMKLLSVDGQSISTIDEMSLAVADSGGRPIPTQWTAVDEIGTPVGAPINATLTTQLRLQRLEQIAADGESRVVDPGLLGLTPALMVAGLPDGSPNKDILQTGDIIARIGDVPYPRFEQLKDVLNANKRGQVEIVVARAGSLMTQMATVDRKGLLNIGIGRAEAPITADPITQVIVSSDASDENRTVETAVADLKADRKLVAGTTVLAVAGSSVSTWGDLTRQVREATADAHGRGEGATIDLEVADPSGAATTHALELSSSEIADVHALTWRSDLPAGSFAPVYRTLSAEGSPLQAIAMGFNETHKTIMMTYLTIDRLVRGSVGVKQLRGPVGIVDLGAKILPKGFMYFIFFLGMISVNLAVLNFLPLPIVDGGLFLFLVYEKIKGRPPSVQFQNFATIIGLCIIGTVFVVTFYNDIARLIS